MRTEFKIKIEKVIYADENSSYGKSTDIYEQTFDDIDIKEIIKVANKISNELV